MALYLSQLLENDPLHGLEPQQRRNRIFLSLERVWMEAAAHSSIVIVVEDLHWADELSLAFLGRLLEAAGQASGQTALLLAVSRPPPDRQSPLGQFLARLGQPPHQVIELQLLDETQAGRLLSGLLGEGKALSELAALIAARAQGNPFFVEELVRSLIEDGSLSREGETGGWQVTRAVADVRVPTTVQGVLAERLDRLPPEDKRLAQHAAIVGRTFWQRLLSEIAGQGVEARLTSIEERQLIVRLAESHIADDWEWLFRHVLVQEVAYSSVTKAMRREVHRAVAEWLEAHTGERGDLFVPLIAYHYEQAQAEAKALHYLSLAAGQAAKAFDNHKAVEFSTRALEFAADDAARFELLSKRQEAYGQLSAREAQWADLQDMLRLAEGLDDDRRARSLNNMGLVTWKRGDIAGTLALYQQALALFRRVEDRANEGACLNNIGMVHWSLGEIEESLANYEQALQLARQAGRFEHVWAVMAYLRKCAYSVRLDLERQERRAERIALDERTADQAGGVEEAALAKLSRDTLCDSVRGWLAANVRDEREKLVITFSYELNLSPAEIARHCPAQFAGAEEVYKIKERLRRAGELRELFEGCESARQ